MTDQITVSRELLRHVVDDLMSINPGNMTPMAEEIWLKSTRALIAALEQSVLEPVNIDQIAAERYKVVEAHESLFHRWAVVAGNGAQQLYVGREVECQNMARKFAGAFLDGAWLASQHPAPQAQQPIGWLRAVDEEMTSTHLGVANITDSYEEAKKKLNSLICWHIDVDSCNLSI